MLSCLSHNTIISSNYEDSTIHLRCTCDHVLYIIGMAWAVNVCVMSLLCLILNVSSGDCDTTLSLLWSLINISEVHCFVARNSCCKNLGDCSCKSGLAVVDMTDSTNVAMRFCTFKLSLCHYYILLN